ncbi:peptide ABC transporter substrate-binding protein [Lachnospiraceae bacterium BX10]|uniref:Peptide ABC transporter substrate-binding protein n=1 Tax=Enterocloster hominis (ex Liu et al. 2021) TaxID=2763663 RepID=A0ABR7NRG8_9FIRM|nr:peptide ABC transporter substrate-binding protein [Enterocloster hominis]MBC8598712.1 peptide ABC transporter substrate-binding protein [Enterocloster hominis]
MKKKVLSAVLAASMCMSFLAGCGNSGSGDSGSSQSGETSKEASKETSKEADTSAAEKGDGEPVSITVGVGQQFTTLDPGLSTETVNRYALAHMYAGLYKKLEDGSVVPDLAAGEPEVSEDGLTYTIKLKDGLVWSDGEPITAHDFVFGINRNLTYGAENGFVTDKMVRYLEGAEEYLADTEVDLETFSFAGVEALDDTTVVYHLKTPCAFFTGLLCGGGFLPLREDVAEAGFSEWAVEPGYPVTGAYVLDYCNENEKVVLTKNESFYDAENVTVDEITFQVMPDMDAQAAAFKTGDLDAALAISASIVSTYENQNELWNRPQQSVYSIDLNSGEKGPEALKDVNVRRALAISINRDEIVKAINAGNFYTPLYGYVPFGMKGAEDDFRKEGDAKQLYQAYDPEKAKELLKEAGYDESNPLTLKYKYSNNSIHADVAQMLEQMWKAVGVNVELEVVESGVFYDQIDQGDFEMARYALMCTNDPSEFLNQWTQAMQPVAAVADDTYDQMMTDVTKIVDRTEYMNKLHEIETYLVEEQVYVIPLFDFNEPALKKENLKGVYMTPGDVPIYSYGYFE